MEMVLYIIGLVIICMTIITVVGLICNAITEIAKREDKAKIIGFKKSVLIVNIV